MSNKDKYSGDFFSYTFVIKVIWKRAHFRITGKKLSLELLKTGNKKICVL